ncbi:hypothetical protein AC1031_013080 [Aphanomyces cochlioides]|nr:hypothetical protein AC1031_013080 [Aphanomyces cochlioides]
MRVLLVNGYSHASHERYHQFKQLVLGSLRYMEKLDVTGMTLLEKHRSDLTEFIFELHSDTSDPAAITRFDRLDFVFVDGDCTLPPWHPGLKKVCTLVKMCMMTGKCLFGATFAASMLAYLCSTGGEMIHAIHNNSKGVSLKTMQSIPPPEDELQPHDVLLDSDTGDYYKFNSVKCAWEPKGNTGIILHSSDRDRDFGSRPNSARGGTRRRKDSTLCHSKLADTTCCGRLEMQNHIYLQGLSRRQFLVNCPSKWDLDERITCTGGNKYTVFVDSQRGPLLIEFGNALCAHFIISKDYTETCTILVNFVKSKFDQIKLHEHIDRSYIASVSGMISHGNNDGSGPFKQIASLATDAPKAPPHFNASNQGRTSPKKCRPLSAAATAKSTNRSRPHSATPTMLAKHSRPTHTKSNQRDGSNDNNRSGVAQEELKFVPPQVKSKVKVCRVVDSQMPYCAYNKFNKMNQEDKTAHAPRTYYSVINDAPYVGPYEKQVVEGEKSKLKWIGGPFRTVFGKASTHIHPEEGILGANYPYDERNIPANVLEPDRNFDHPKASKTKRRP